MARVYATVKYAKWLDDREFLEESADWFKLIHREDETTEELDWIIGSLLADVTWFPYGEFDAKLAEERLITANWEITQTLKEWLKFTEEQCNEIKKCVGKDV